MSTICVRGLARPRVLIAVPPSSLAPMQMQGRSRSWNCSQIRALSSSPVQAQVQTPLAGLGSAEIEAAHRYCVEVLRTCDRPSYTLAPFIPSRARRLHVALRALNVAVAQVPDATASPAMAAMRLQFWREAVGRVLDGDGRVPREPAIVLLAAALGELAEQRQGQQGQGQSPLHTRTARNWLLRLINAREQFLLGHTAPFVSLAVLESYAEQTQATLLYLTLAALPLSSLTADHLASHIGKAAGIVTVLRGVPMAVFPQATPSQAASGSSSATPTPPASLPLPLDILADCRVTDESVFRQGPDAPGLRDAVFAVATRAHDHLLTARVMLANLKRGGDVGHEFEHAEEHGYGYGEQQGMVDDNNRNDEQPASAALAHQQQLAEVDRAFGVLVPPTVASALWLERLQNVDFDVFDPTLRGVAGGRGGGGAGVDWRLPWRAYWAWRQQVL